METKQMVGAPSAPPAPVDVLIALLTTEVAPTTWNHEGGRGKISKFNRQGYRLVISQTADIHYHVASLLDALRKTVDRPTRPGEASRAPTPVSVLACLSPEVEAFQKRAAYAMAHLVSVDFENFPLMEALRSFENVLPADKRISILVDTKALEDSGFDQATTVTFHARNIALRSALDPLLGRLDLTWEPMDGVILITTKEKGDSQQITRVYNVTDLVGRIKTGTMKDVRDSMDSLIDLIGTTVAPTTWDEVGGPARVCSEFMVNGCRLVFSQTRQVHEQIADLLSQLRANDLEQEPSPQEKQVTAALEHRLTVNFDRVTIRDAIKSLAESLPDDKKVSMSFDLNPIRDMIDRDLQLVTLKAFNVRLRSVLDIMLKPLDLGWNQTDHGIDITTRESSGFATAIRVYNVEDLIGGNPDAPLTRKAALARLGVLDDLIKEMVAPNAWSGQGGSGDMATFSGSGGRHRLVVCQSPSVHENIRKLLAVLREESQQPGERPDSGRIVFPMDGKLFAAALDHLVSVDFDEMPLSQALRELTDQLPEASHVPIICDRQLMEAAGQDMQVTVTLLVKDAALGKVLADMLDPVEFACVVNDYAARNEALWICPRSAVQDRCKTVVYDVTDLTSAETDSDAPGKRDELLELILGFAPSESWIENGGPATAHLAKFERSWLVIRQTPSIQELIARKLVKLRADKVEKKSP